MLQDADDRGEFASIVAVVLCTLPHLLAVESHRPAVAGELLLFQKNTKEQACAAGGVFLDEISERVEVLRSLRIQFNICKVMMMTLVMNGLVTSFDTY